MEEIDLETLLFQLKHRMKTGVEVFKGVPYIHGYPAKKDSELPLIDILSEWCCPHCNAHLVKESYICLNGCHLTASQYKTMQADLMRASGRVAQVRGWIDGLYNDLSDFPEWFDGFTDVYFHMVSDTVPFDDLKEYFLTITFIGFKGLGLRHDLKRYGLFKEKDDYIKFKLQFG